MADPQENEKTEEATETRREEFRKQGQVAHTRELGTAVVLLVGAGLLGFVGKFFFGQVEALFFESYGPSLVERVRENQLMEGVKVAGIRLLILSLPVMVLSMVLGVMSSVVQVGLLQTEDAISPDINRINPVEGFKRLFSLRAFVEGLKSFLKIGLIGFVVFLMIRNELYVLPKLWTLDLMSLAAYVGAILGKLFLGVGFVMLILAGADYFYQRWDLEKKMMMTKQEVKDELKQREGDPLIKARIRRVQRDLANKRMMEDVPKATVIITNPTHIACALKYDDSLPAPQLVAKGGDLVAEKIKEIAKENRIPVVENKPLARTIFKTMKVGQIIPRDLFVAVAEVLSYVFKLKQASRRS